MKLGQTVTITGVVGEIVDHGHDLNIRIDAPKGGPSIWMMGDKLGCFAPGVSEVEPEAVEEAKPASAKAPAKKKASKAPAKKKASK